MFNFKLKILLVVFSFMFFPLHASKFIDQVNYLTSMLGSIPEVDFSNIPLYFIPNQGQTNSEVLYYATTSKYTLWLAEKGLVFDIILPDERTKPDSFPKARTNSMEPQYFPVKRAVSKLEFINSTKNVKTEPDDLTDFSVNYFKGQNVSDWKTGIKASKAVVYKNLYDHIDLKLYGVISEIEYDFIIRPGGKVSDIKLQYKDVNQVEIDGSGDLLIKTDFGVLKHEKPICFQQINGKRKNVSGRFVLLDENIFGFDVDEYDMNFDLIIDPMVLVYSGYLGGSGNDENSWAIDVDSQGAVYLTGWTNSLDFPLADPILSSHSGIVDVFVVKVNPDGRSLDFATYVGGSGYDAGFGIEVDSKGNIYVAGETESYNFPVKKPLISRKVGAWDGFVLKLKRNGKALLYSTYFGSSDCDSGKDIAIDKDGNYYILGTTRSPYFPLKKAFQKNFGGYWDAWVAKINSTGRKLVYSSYIGGAGEEDGLAIAVDSKGYAYVTGCTYSEDFPLVKPIQKNFGGIFDAYVLKVSKNGRRLIYSTFLGGAREDCGYGIAVDSKGYASISGETRSKDFPTVDPIVKKKRGGYDVFAAKLVPRGNRLEASTFIGGKKHDHGKRIALDLEGAAYITGVTFSQNFPTKDALYKKYSGDGDGFVVKIDSNWKKLVFSSFLGGSSWDVGQDIAVDESGQIYITGFTESDDFPAYRSFQKKKARYADGFICAFSLDRQK